MNKSCKFLYGNELDFKSIVEYRNLGLKIIPILNEQNVIIDLLNFSKELTKLPIDAVIMAGGKGTRLLPLTQNTPKPLLKVGDKPILQHNIDRLTKFGIRNIHVTVNYLKEQIQEYISTLNHSEGSIECVVENKPLGTVGGLNLINDWNNDFILLINSDVLTNIDYEDFFLEFIKSDADMMVAAMPYPIKVPYAILETEGDEIMAFKEKPEYIHLANTGIYLFKREVLSFLPGEGFSNATDLMGTIIGNKKKLSFYPMVNYWLDIGKHDDFKKAQEDIKHIKL
jgi:NDP-sugar pyrophosphorylase family protein